MSLSSREEKREQFLKEGRLEHWLYISELRNLLSELEDDWWVVPNEVENLTIFRMTDSSNKEQEAIGVVDFSSNEVWMFNEEEKDD